MSSAEMMHMPNKRKCVRPQGTSSPWHMEASTAAPLVFAAPVAIDMLHGSTTNLPVVPHTAAGALNTWPLEMSVYMMSGEPCCTISLHSLEMRVPEIKHMIELKIGVPRAEQQIVLDGSPESMRDECRLCHYAEALFASSPRMYLVRKAPLEKPLSRTTWRRLQKEFQMASNSNVLADCKLTPSSGNLEESPLSWKGEINVSEGPYEGGAFSLDISLPVDYPYKPPLVFFSTHIFHPLVASNGSIDLDVLSDKWLPAMTLESVVLQIRGMFKAPYAVTSCCGNHEAALLSHDKVAFDSRVREEISLHAKLTA